MKNHILMNDFTKEYSVSRQSLLRKLDRFFVSGSYILGPNTKAFETAFARYTDSKYCVGVGNGLEAIQIALMSLGVQKGDEVITVSNSDVATALAIIYVGATPVFVDVDEYFHMDPKLIEGAITKKTKVILPVHLFGQVANMDEIMRIAKKHKLLVVEDACQAHGATHQGKKAGTFGVVGCFSFYPTKNLGAAGDAGAIITNDASLYKKCAMLRNRGASSRCVHPLRGLNSRLDEIQAVILRHKLPHLDALNKRRIRIAEKYAKELSSISEIMLPLVRKNTKHVFHQFVIRVPKREKLMKYLEQRGVDVLVHYPTPIHRQDSLVEFHAARVPNTDRLAKEIVSLPVHPQLTDKQVNMVIKAISTFYQ